MADLKKAASMPPDAEPLQDFVGRSGSLQKLVNEVRTAAAVDGPVLISGETGTGKEFTARAIHRLSVRSKGPFIAVNCIALPASLIQAELFGHEKDAFTGGHAKKIGQIEAAKRGTLFLDEIGDLSLDLQVSLLRFLQDKAIKPVGGTRKVHVDTRVIVATHVDLEAAVREKRFREDLYCRLDVLHLRVPSLRQRKGDPESPTSGFAGGW